MVIVKSITKFIIKVMTVKVNKSAKGTIIFYIYSLTKLT